MPSTPTSTPVPIAALFVRLLLPVSGNELAETDVFFNCEFETLGQVFAEPQLGLGLGLGQVVLDPQLV